MDNEVTSHHAQRVDTSRAWPPELRALITLLRAALGTACSSAKDFSQPAKPCAPALLECIVRHRVGAFLHHRLPSEWREQLPTELSTQLEKLAQQNARRALARSAELITVSRLFRAANIPFLSVKGPLLAQALYGDLGTRHAGDLDLLIHPDHLTRADLVLCTAGYRRSQPDFELTPRQWSEYQELKHEFEYFNDATGVRLEVQWRLEGFSEQSFNEWLAAGVQASLGGEIITRLPTETEILYLFVHGAGHGWTNLFWLVDVALLLARSDLDWKSLGRLAQAHQVEQPVWQASVLVEQLLGTSPPEALQVPFKRRSRVNWLACEAIRLMQTTALKRQGLRELLRQTSYQLRLRQSWAGKAAVLRPRLLSPACWKQLKLPDRWFLLYYPAAPALWLRRQFQKRGGAF